MSIKSKTVVCFIEIGSWGLVATLVLHRLINLTQQIMTEYPCQSKHKDQLSVIVIECYRHMFPESRVCLFIVYSFDAQGHVTHAIPCPSVISCNVFSSLAARALTQQHGNMWSRQCDPS